MRILITCDFFPPDVYGGTEIVACQTAKILQAHGHKVEVLCRGNPKIKSFEGIRTARIPLRKWYLANILLIPTLYKYARKADVIHNFTFDTSFASIFWAKILHKPSITSIQGVYGDAWVEMRKSWIKGKIRKFFEKIHLRLPFDRFHVISEHSKKMAIKLGLRKDKAVLIPWGVDVKRYHMSKKQPFVLFIGRIVPQKGVNYLIEAARKLPNIKFYLAGEGSERKRLEKIAPPNVKFLGFVSEKKKIKLLSESLVFTLPSIGEGLGLVLLEAMASGCAIISTIPFDYSGFVVKPRDSNELANKIKYLMENRKIALRMGKENRKKVKKYKWENILKIYEKIR
jgi:glycosyltransferase involved in cell wall biosynthesis